MYSVFSHFDFSGTVPISGLTETTHPNLVEPIIRKNLHKKGYREAVKEFLDEKCATVHAQSELSTVPLRRSSRLRNKNAIAHTNAVKPATLSAIIPTTKLAPEVTLRSSVRLRIQNSNMDTVANTALPVPISKQSAAPVRASSRLRKKRHPPVPAIVGNKELTSGMTLRSSSRKQNRNTNTDTAVVIPAKKK